MSATPEQMLGMRPCRASGSSGEVQPRAPGPRPCAEREPGDSAAAAGKSEPCNEPTRGMDLLFPCDGSRAGRPLPERSESLSHGLRKFYVPVNFYHLKTCPNPSYFLCFFKKEREGNQAGGDRARVGLGLMVSDCAFQYVAEHVDAPQLTSSFEATINKFDKNFSAHLLDLLARLSLYSTSDCEHSMASVISRWVQAASAHQHGPSCVRALPRTVLCPSGRGSQPPPTLPVLPHRCLRPPREGVTEAGSAWAQLCPSPPCRCGSPAVTEACAAAGGLQREVRARRFVFRRECAPACAGLPY